MVCGAQTDDQEARQPSRIRDSTTTVRRASTERTACGSPATCTETFDPSSGPVSPRGEQSRGASRISARDSSTGIQGMFEKPAGACLKTDLGRKCIHNIDGTSSQIYSSAPTMSSSPFPVDHSSILLFPQGFRRSKRRPAIRSTLAVQRMQVPRPRLYAQYARQNSMTLRENFHTHIIRKAMSRMIRSFSQMAECMDEIASSR